MNAQIMQPVVAALLLAHLTIMDFDMNSVVVHVARKYDPPVAGDQSGFVERRCNSRKVLLSQINPSKCFTDLATS